MWNHITQKVEYTMRKILSSILLATVAGALAIGAAASMPVSSANLGSGSTGVTACDSDGINVSYVFADGEPQLVTGVTLEGVAAECDGQTVNVVVSYGESVIAAEATGTLSAEATQSFDLAVREDYVIEGSVLSADINEVAVTIAGGASAAPELVEEPELEEEEEL